MWIKVFGNRGIAREQNLIIFKYELNSMINPMD